MPTPGTKCILTIPHTRRVIGRQVPNELPALYLHDPRDPYRYALPTVAARLSAGLGLNDLAPFSKREQLSAWTIGLTPLALRMGEAVLDRAPQGLIELWRSNDHTTVRAYAVLIRLEARDKHETFRRGRR